MPFAKPSIIAVVSVAVFSLPFVACAWQRGHVPFRHSGAFGVSRSWGILRTESRGTGDDTSSSPSDKDQIVQLKAAVACGFSSRELQHVVQIVKTSCNVMGFHCNVDSLQTMPAATSSRIHGPTGRILVLQFPGQVEQDTLAALNDMITSSVDENLYSSSPQLKDPFLLRFELDDDNDDGNNEPLSWSSIVKQAVQEGELRVPLAQTAINNNIEWDSISFLPSKVLQVDGAYIQEPKGTSPETWDTSSVFVFDDLVSCNLRRRLAQVIGRGKDLVGEHSPDPAQWKRGGLSDKLEYEHESEPSSSAPSVSYGLTYEAIQELCFQPHGAIVDMEIILSKLFSDFVVTRLPQAVFGEAVSPLTANAPLHGDVFDYHIDADPYVTPPSLWTDIYGRYPNRSTGKPRFVSFLVYLNDEWHDAWGGPTRFLDVASDTEYAVLPRPGRCIVMDQDVSHAVTAPREAAGRPRYSLVWKLVLHPKLDNQDMRNLTAGRNWPEPILLGSANQSKG